MELVEISEDFSKRWYDEQPPDKIDRYFEHLVDKDYLVRWGGVETERTSVPYYKKNKLYVSVEYKVAGDDIVRRTN